MATGPRAGQQTNASLQQFGSLTHALTRTHALPRAHTCKALHKAFSTLAAKLPWKQHTEAAAKVLGGDCAIIMVEPTLGVV